MKIRNKLILLCLLVSSLAFTYREQVNNDAMVSCDGPSSIALFRNGGGPAIAPGMSLLPNTMYTVKIATDGDAVYACVTGTTGLSSSPSCNDITPGGLFYLFGSVTTNSSLPSGVSISIQGYCWNGSNYVPGGTTTFTFP